MRQKITPDQCRHYPWSLSFQGVDMSVIIENMRNANTRSTKAQAVYKADLISNVDELQLQVSELKADRSLLWCLVALLTCMLVYVCVGDIGARVGKVYAKSELTATQMSELNIMPERSHVKNSY